MATRFPHNVGFQPQGVQMYPSMVGQWHPTVLYLVGLILAEIIFVGLLRKFPMPI